MTDLKVNTIDDGVIFTAKIVPGSSKTAIAGLLNGALKIKIAAPPEHGKANRALIEFLAKKLGVKKNALTIISGKTTHLKQLKIAGLSSDSLLEKLHLKK